MHHADDSLGRKGNGVVVGVGQRAIFQRAKERLILSMPWGCDAPDERDGKRTQHWMFQEEGLPALNFPGSPPAAPAFLAGSRRPARSWLGFRRRARLAWVVW